ncbi:hypothetical protein RJ640_022174 [Escallonia rubra]|uniref:M-phase phosphoprotein 6 n=1 Tax=Escallonia rubra TaxID=112253 RepID=A0AA88S5F1_9ASTE|nr:hypothetical protein RJ640_022174 [Escallonia rubra]
MAKRELSTTLKNLKFMQRAAPKEEKSKKEEETTPNGSFPPSSTPKRWYGEMEGSVVITEGDPHPGARKGRMSFQSFNPSIDKLNEEGANVRQPEGSSSSSGNQSGGTPNRSSVSFNIRCAMFLLSGINGCRENGSSQDGSENLKQGHTNGDLKRKPGAAVAEIRYPNKSQKIDQGMQHSSSNNSSSQKQPKRDKLDFNVLRPSKSQNKRVGPQQE